MTLTDTLLRVAAPLRRAHTVGLLLPGVAAGVAALAGAAWLARLGAGGPALLVLIAWMLLALALAAAIVMGLRARGRLGASGVATRLEASGAWRRGALATLLAPLAEGTSDTLHRAAVDAETRRVELEGTAALAPSTTAARRRVTRWAGVVAVLALILIAARPADATRGMLLRPWQAWRAIVAPVRLTTSTPVVDRGEVALLDLEALGQQEAILLTRAPGEGWQRRIVPLDGMGRAQVATDPLDADLVVRVEAAGRRSPELRVVVRVPAFVGAVVLRAAYPRYLALEDEALPTDGDTLVVPEGTTLTLTGEATTALAVGRLLGEDGAVPLTLDGGRFRSTFVPTRDAAWTLELEASQGGRLEGIPPPLPVRVIADSAPTVSIPVPGGDTIAPPSRLIPVVVGLEDDHGLASAMIELRRGGLPVVRMPLPLDGPTDRALLTATVDLNALGAAPGDTVLYRAVATDNAPRPRIGQSREYRIVVPTAAAERAARAAATAETAADLDALVDAARDAQRAAEDLARERQRAGTGAGEAGQGETMSAEAARRAEQAAQAQGEVERQLEAMRQQVAELEAAAERNGAEDPSLAEDLREIRELLDQAMSPALREAMDRLRESLRSLDPQATRDALRDVAEQQQRMREALERARDLFDRAALETELAGLAEEADELRAAQEAAAAQLAADSAAGARAEESLAARADSLAGALDAAAERSPAEAAAEGLRDAAEQAREAGAQMRAAAQSARQGKRQQAQQQARAAGEMLEPLGEQIGEQREQMQEAMREEVLADLDRLLGETTRVLSRQYAVAEAFRRGALVGPLRAEETMLEEATAKLLQQVITVAGKNALISPRISVALAGARDGLRAAIEASSAAAPSLGLAADRAGDAVDLLAVAAYALLQSRRNVEGSESGSGLEEAMQQMMQMAGQQSAAADQGQSMQQQGAEPGMGELMQLAMQQRAVAQQLERMRAQGQIPGAGELAREAQDLARQIEAGRLSAETVERQQKLFRRMLDAGRSLEGEQDEQSTERQSEGAREGTTARPAALDPRWRQGPAFQLPSWDALQRLDPDDRRRVLDYFRRLTEVGTP